MMKMLNGEGWSCTYCVGGDFDIQLQQEEAERKAYEKEMAIEEENRLWLRTHDSSHPLYSDIFKDVYGYRPRW